jgi:hypothetical protein
VHPDDYSFCHQIAHAERSKGQAYLLVPSARKAGGCCVPVFDRAAVSVIEAYGPFRLTWDAVNEEAYAVTPTGKRRVAIDRVYDLP